MFRRVLMLIAVGCFFVTPSLAADEILIADFEQQTYGDWNVEGEEENHLPTKEMNDDFLSRGGHWYAHYNGSASNYSLVGYALAEALNPAK